MTHPSLRNLTSPPQDAGAADAPEQFRAALASLAAVRPRSEIVLRETPAPARIAPFSYAMAAHLAVPDAEDAEEDVEAATARFIVLHDPEGHEAWHGTTRVVVYLSTVVGEGWADDGRVSPLAWNWLTDALAARGAEHHHLGGTVTRTVSDRYGDLAEPAPSVELEMRGSWTAEGTALDRHLSAWLDVFGQAAGLASADGTAADRSEGDGR